MGDTYSQPIAQSSGKGKYFVIGVIAVIVAVILFFLFSRKGNDNTGISNANNNSSSPTSENSNTRTTNKACKDTCEELISLARLREITGLQDLIYTYSTTGTNQVNKPQHGVCYISHGNKPAGNIGSYCEAGAKEVYEANKQSFLSAPKEFVDKNYESLTLGQDSYLWKVYPAAAVLKNDQTYFGITFFGASDGVIKELIEELDKNIK